MGKFILLIILSFSAYAQNFMPVSSIQAKGSAGFSLQKECEKLSKEQCLDVGDRPEVVRLGLFKLDDVIGDDYSKPKYGPESDVQECSGEDECRKILVDKRCQEKFFAFIDVDYKKVYCTELLGYEQSVVGKSFSIDRDAVEAYREQLRIKAEEDKTNAEKKRLAIERIRQFSTSGLDNATTVAGVKAAVKAALVDIIEILK